MAEHLRDAILSHAPNFRILPTALARWARDIDLAIRVDGRDPARLRALATFAHSGVRDYYLVAVLSGKKLRAMFDELDIAEQAQARRFAERGMPAGKYRAMGSGLSAGDIFRAAAAVRAAREGS